MQPTPGHNLAASYFDGQSAKARPVTLSLFNGHLLVKGDGVERSVDVADVQWPERTRHGFVIANTTVATLKRLHAETGLARGSDRPHRLVAPTSNENARLATATTGR